MIKVFKEKNLFGERTNLYIVDTELRGILMLNALDSGDWVFYVFGPNGKPNENSIRISKKQTEIYNMFELLCIDFKSTWAKLERIPLRSENYLKEYKFKKFIEGNTFTICSQDFTPNSENCERNYTAITKNVDEIIITTKNALNMDNNNVIINTNCGDYKPLLGCIAKFWRKFLTLDCAQESENVLLDCKKIFANNSTKNGDRKL